MKPGFGILRMVFVLFAAVMVAGASLVAPASELSEELRHAALHASDNGYHGGSTAVASDQGSQPAGHQHPGTPGHTHCGASCHVQLSDSRLAVAIAFAVANPPFAATADIPYPASHLDGLFRPPRA